MGSALDRNLTLVPLGNGNVDSTKPDGDPLSGGDATLSWVIADGEVTFTTDGTNPFGSVAPEFIMLIDVTNAVLGTLESSSISIGAGVTLNYQGANKFQVASIAGMSGGKGIVTGGLGAGLNEDLTPRIEVTHDNYTRLFESKVNYWPQVNQDNATDELTNNIATWQMKPVWWQSDETFNGTDTDFFLSTLNAFHDPSKAFLNHVEVKSNSVPTRNLTAGSVLNDSSDALKRQFPSPYYIEAAWDQGTADGVTADGSLAALISRSDLANVHNNTTTDLILAEPTGATKVINSFSYPGFIRGFHPDRNQHFFEGDIYLAGGAGAYCRVAITENPDYFLSRERVMLEPVAWANLELVMNFRTGIFGSEYVGKYFCIIGVNNTQLVSIQI